MRAIIIKILLTGFFFLFLNEVFGQQLKMEKKVESQHTIIQWGDTIGVSRERKEKDTPEQKNRKYGAEYGRIIKLNEGRWLVAYTVSRNEGYKKDPKGGLAIQIAESTDKGRHWTALALISDPGRDVDNAAFIELPDHSVLLACRSVRWQESYRLLVYRSTDKGQNWQRWSEIDTNEGQPGSLGHPDKGLYEPHFCFLPNGQLAVMYANEKHVTEKPSYSQIISERISSDRGRSWGKEIRVAYTPGDAKARPGMPVWTRMKNGKYIVVYEVCGSEDCDIYYKVSRDGVQWPVGVGHFIPGQNGAPYVLSLKNGTLLLTSNKGNLSISEDFGKNWYLGSNPWRPAKSYAEDWTQTIWSSLFQVDPNKVGIISSVKQTDGRHSILLRYGNILKK